MEEIHGLNARREEEKKEESPLSFSQDSKFASPSFPSFSIPPMPTDSTPQIRQSEDVSQVLFGFTEETPKTSVPLDQLFRQVLPHNNEARYKTESEALTHGQPFMKDVVPESPDIQNEKLRQEIAELETIINRKLREREAPKSDFWEHIQNKNEELKKDIVDLKKAPNGYTHDMAVRDCNKLEEDIGQLDENLKETFKKFECNLDLNSFRERVGNTCENLKELHRKNEKRKDFKITEQLNLKTRKKNKKIKSESKRMDFIAFVSFLIIAFIFYWVIIPIYTRKRIQ